MLSFELNDLKISSASQDTAIGAGDLGFDSRVGQIAALTQYHQRLATAANFFRSCIAYALSRGNGSRHSLHVSEKYREYNENFIF